MFLAPYYLVMVIAGYQGGTISVAPAPIPMESLTACNDAKDQAMHDFADRLRGVSCIPTGAK